MEQWRELVIMFVVQMNEAHLIFSKTVTKKQEKVGFANNDKTLSSLLAHRLISIVALLFYHLWSFQSPPLSGNLMILEPIFILVQLY